MAKKVNDKREIRGWTMYDWAMSAFSTTVVTVFLGPYLTNLAEQAADASGMLYIGNVPIAFSSYFSYAISASVLMQVTFLPILGALADYSNVRKRMMMFFSTLGAVSTIMMFFLTPGLHWLGGMLFILANVSLGASVVFYNAYLPEIASEDQRDRVSSSGFAMGYLGGGLLLVINLAMFTLMDDGALAARLSLASAGIWWLGFSVITFTRLEERDAPRSLPEGETYFTIGFTQLAKLVETKTSTIAALMSLPLLVPVLFFLQPALNLDIRIVLAPALGPMLIFVLFLARKSKTLPEAMKYLAAYLLYNDGIQTVIAISAVFAAEELGMPTEQLILVILMIQFV
ncbi:MAG: MFS transporter, partial [Chloroflexota bacterium]